jgi:hypothetical protein
MPETASEAPKIDPCERGHAIALSIIRGDVYALPAPESLHETEKRSFIDGCALGLMEHIESEERFWNEILAVAHHIQYYLRRNYGNWMSGMFGKQGYNIGTAQCFLLLAEDTRQAVQRSIGTTPQSQPLPDMQPHPPRNSEPYRARLADLFAELRSYNDSDDRDGWVLAVEQNGLEDAREREVAMQRYTQELIEDYWSTGGSDQSIVNICIAAAREIRMRRAVQELMPEAHVVSNQNLTGQPPEFKKFRTTPAVRDFVYEIARYLVREQKHRFTQLATMQYSSPE